MNMYDFPKEGRSQLAVGVVIKLVGLAVVVVVVVVGH